MNQKNRWVGGKKRENIKSSCWCGTAHNSAIPYRTLPRQCSRGRVEAEHLRWKFPCKAFGFNSAARVYADRGVEIVPPGLRLAEILFRNDLCFRQGKKSALETPRLTYVLSCSPYSLNPHFPCFCEGFPVA